MDERASRGWKLQELRRAVKRRLVAKLCALLCRYCRKRLHPDSLELSERS